MKQWVREELTTGKAGESSGGIKTLPQRLRDAFIDGSLNLPEQCLWNMQLAGLSRDKVSRWSGFPACQADQAVGSTQRKNCLPEHQCGQCSTGYADYNTDCADPTTPLGSPGAADVCHRAPQLKITESTSVNGSPLANIQVSLQQHKKDSVMPQLFNV